MLVELSILISCKSKEYVPSAKILTIMTCLDITPGTIGKDVSRPFHVNRMETYYNLGVSMDSK